MSTIALESITKQFGDLTAVNDVSYTINDGEFFVIVGPSGCGKSTTLRMIAGFETPTAGEITRDGEPMTHLPPEDRDVRMVFQDYALFPHLSVQENLEFGLKMNNVDASTYRDKVTEVLDLVGLPNIKGKYPSSLSGGQQQRIALARSLILEPDVLLLDEPLSNLDKNLRDRMQVELKRIQRETGVTAIHVTHNQEEALSLADRVCVMNDGIVEQIGPPEDIYYHPKNRFVADFLGDSNIFSANITEDNANKTSLRPDGAGVDLITELPSDASSEGDVFFRPEHVQIADEFPGMDGENVFSATVRNRLFTGDKVKYELTLNEAPTDADIHLTAYSHGQWDVHTTVQVHVPQDRVLML